MSNIVRLAATLFDFVDTTIVLQEQEIATAQTQTSLTTTTPASNIQLRIYCPLSRWLAKSRIQQRDWRWYSEYSY